MFKFPIKYLPLTGVALLAVVIGFFLFKAGDKDLKDSDEDIFPEKGLAGLHLIRNDPDEGARFELKADNVMPSEDGKTFQLNNFNFRLESDDSLSFELEGEIADYKQEEGYLTTDDTVTLKGSFFSVTGKGLRVDLKNGTLRILSDINTVIDKGSFGL